MERPANADGDAAYCCVVPTLAAGVSLSRHVFRQMGSAPTAMDRKSGISAPFFKLRGKLTVYLLEMGYRDLGFRRNTTPQARL